MPTPRKYKCPYCDRVSMSPGGLRLHIRSKHPDKIEEFDEEHYPAMKEEFNK